jgi:putative DNA primase/helicase
VPAELRALRQWILWGWEEDKGGRKKVPLLAGGRIKAKSNAPSTWTTFSEACKALANNDRFAGIGFVFSEKDPYVGFDFDGCLVEGELAEWARSHLEDLAGCYAEISPSGNGVKVWCRGVLTGTGGKRSVGRDKHTGIEMYDRGRFFCVTGEAYGEAAAEIPDRQEVVDHLYAWVKEPKKASPPQRAAAPETAAEARAIRYLKTMDPAVSGQGGHDRTFRAACKMVEFGLSYDQALAALLSDYNPRCDPPWTEKDLRHKLDDAFERAELGKMLAKDRNGHQASNGRPETAATIQAPFLAEQLDARLAKVPRTDMGNAERFAARHGAIVRYCNPWGRWLIWDGRRFAVDQTDGIQALAKATARKILAEASTIEGDDECKGHLQHARATESRAKLEALTALARSEPGIPILPADMDRDGWLFNCENGTVDLRTGTLRPHDRADVLTQLCPVVFHPDADCPLWDATLDLFFAGDQKLIRYWQRLCGYALVGLIRDHVMPVAYGDGSNGKSTILGTLLEVFGPDYAMKAPASFLMAKVHDPHPTDRADLFRKRLVVAIETEDGRRLDETMVKELTGGDDIRARRMREDHWQFKPTHTLFMATNHRPTIRGTDHGIWRRLKLVPFSVKVDGEKADTTMAEKLRAEFPGILAWCVRGCSAWQEVGLNEPDSVRIATDDYRAEQDVLGTFLADRTIRGPGARTRCNAMYATYREWAEKAGEHPVTMKRFGQAMKERGFSTATSNGKWYLDVGLPEAVKDEAGGRESRSEDPDWGVVA